MKQVWAFHELGVICLQAQKEANTGSALDGSFSPQASALSAYVQFKQ